MFKFLKKKSAQEKLEGEHLRKLEEAQAAQRGGNMRLFANLMAEAEEIGVQLDRERLFASKP